MNTKLFNSRFVHFACIVALTIGSGISSAKGPPPGKGPGNGGGGGGGDDGGSNESDHKGRQTAPIKLGTSGGSLTDLANGYCCSGTLGSLVEDANGTQYVMSNTHVFAGDSVVGGNGKVATPGDAINQPGYIDVSCQDIPNDYGATLTEWIDLPPSAVGTVDAAIAEVVPGMVSADGYILEIGTVSSTPVDAFVGQNVKKSGRTSGLTNGRVSALNATVNVGYEDECAGDGFVTTFTGQIIVNTKNFLKGGDSGSVMFERVSTNPRPVGLLYAGSRRTAVASPIQDVLDELTLAMGSNITMVGTPSGAASTATPAGGSGNGSAKAKAAQEKNAARLMQVRGSVGHAIGKTKGNSGKMVVKVLVPEITPEAEADLPDSVDGVKVELMAVGDIIAY
jgi:hypothetical protein